MHYRFYCLDDSGHVASGTDVEASDDLAAIEIAQERCKDDTIEVWQANRLVVQITKVDSSPVAYRRAAARL